MTATDCSAIYGRRLVTSVGCIGGWPVQAPLGAGLFCGERCQSLTILANRTILEWNSSKNAMPLNVNLTPQLEELVRRKVSSGRYNSASEVVREALRIMEAHD